MTKTRPTQTLDDLFIAYDKANPQIYVLFKRFAKEVLDAGHKSYSADAIIHRIRWHTNVEVKDRDNSFKINNYFRSRYARKLMAEDTEFAGFFETRQLRQLPDAKEVERAAA